MKKISLVVPCYNEQEVIKIFYAEIQKIKKDFNNVTFEIKSRYCLKEQSCQNFNKMRET